MNGSQQWLSKHPHGCLEFQGGTETKIITELNRNTEREKREILGNIWAELHSLNVKREQKYLFLCLVSIHKDFLNVIVSLQSDSFASSSHVFTLVAPPAHLRRSSGTGTGSATRSPAQQRSPPGPECTAACCSRRAGHRFRALLSAGPSSLRPPPRSGSCSCNPAAPHLRAGQPQTLWRARGSARAASPCCSSASGRLRAGRGQEWKEAEQNGERQKERVARKLQLLGRWWGVTAGPQLLDSGPTSGQQKGPV